MAERYSDRRSSCNVDDNDVDDDDVDGDNVRTCATGLRRTGDQCCKRYFAQNEQDLYRSRVCGG